MAHFYCLHPAQATMDRHHHHLNHQKMMEDQAAQVEEELPNLMPMMEVLSPISPPQLITTSPNNKPSNRKS